MRDRFATIGIGPDGSFDADKLSPEMRRRSRAAWPTRGRSSTTFKKDKIDTGQVGAAEFFGTRADLKGNYLYRMAGAVLGIYGNTAAEAIYPTSPTTPPAAARPARTTTPTTSHRISCRPSTRSGR